MKEIHQIKNSRPTLFEEIKNSVKSGDVWSHVYGILGTISLIFTTVYSIVSFRNHDEVEYKTVVVTLSMIVCSIVVTFIFAVAYYQRRFRYLNELPLLLMDTKAKNDKLNLMVKAKSECIHTITHYYRNIESQLDDFLSKEITKEYPNESSCNKLLERCKDFLLNTTTSLHYYYTIASGYTCSVTIKIVLNDTSTGNHYVKTLFRDPLSLKKRRYVESAYSSPLGIYPASENTAFDIILSPNHINNFYAADNLREQYELHNYKNSNKFWNNHYNSTIVVPIAIVRGKNNRHVIGFIAIDNLTAQSGNLNDEAKIEFLFSIGDLLYNFIKKYLDIITFANQKFKIDDFHKQIITWS